MNTYRGFKTFKSQEKKWKGSAIGQCIKERMHHFNWMKKHYHNRSTGDRKRSYAKVERACKKIKATWLPFANESCMTMLDWEYGIVLDEEKAFEKSDNSRTLKKLEGSMKKSQQILKHNCMNWSFKRHAPHCKTYMMQRLQSNADKLERENRNDVSSKFLGKLLTNYERIYETLMSESFWLNAPDDCGIGKKDGGASHYNNKHGLVSWLNSWKNKKWNKHHANSWKNNWRRSNRRNYRRHGGKWNDRRSHKNKNHNNSKRHHSRRNDNNDWN